MTLASLLPGLRRYQSSSSANASSSPGFHNRVFANVPSKAVWHPRNVSPVVLFSNKHESHRPSRQNVDVVDTAPHRIAAAKRFSPVSATHVVSITAVGSSSDGRTKTTEMEMFSCGAPLPSASVALGCRRAAGRALRLPDPRGRGRSVGAAAGRVTAVTTHDAIGCGTECRVPNRFSLPVVETRHLYPLLCFRVTRHNHAHLSSHLTMATFTIAASVQFAGARLDTRRGSAAPRSARRAAVVTNAGPKRVMIAGAPASGKGTQCELIVERYGLVHISAGDLLRAAVAAGTPAGVEAKDYMDRGDLVPDSCVVTMVVDALNVPDAKEKGWLLDGYPRSASQADAIKAQGIEPDTFLLLDVPDAKLVERVVGRRLDPETGKIYHLTFSPPPSDIAGRLTQRSDDTEEKALNRLKVHHSNVNAVVGKYSDKLRNLNGDRAKGEVFDEICGIIDSM